MDEIEHRFNQVLEVYDRIYNKIDDQSDHHAPINPMIPVGLTIAYFILKGLDELEVNTRELR